MSRKSYGESMAQWERQSDERYWEISLQKAIAEKDESKIKNLVKEGICEDYSFNSFAKESIVDRFLDEYLK